MKPYELIAVVFVIGCLAVGCGNNAPLGKTILLAPDSSVVAVGARRDVIPVACDRKFSISNLVQVTLIAAAFTAFGRIDVLVEVPEALIPGCSRLPVEVTNTAVEPNGVFETSIDGRVITLQALAEGQAGLTVDVLAGGEPEVLSGSFRALPVDTIAVDFSCEDDSTGTFVYDQLHVPVDSEVFLNVRMLNGTTPLTGYGLDLVNVAGATLEMNENNATYLLKVGPSPTNIEMTSSLVSGFSRSFESYRADDYDTFRFDATVPAEVYAGQVLSARTVGLFSGKLPCRDTIERTVTSRTPEICAPRLYAGNFITSEISVSGNRSFEILPLKVGRCEIDAVISGSNQADQLHFDVVGGWEPIKDAALDNFHPYGVWSHTPVGGSSQDLVLVGGEDALIDDVRDPDPAKRTIAIRTFDGSAWVVDNFPDNERLVDIWGTGSGDFVMAVGDRGTVLIRKAGIWQIDAFKASSPLRGVWGFATDQIYVVGDEGAFYQYDGSAFTAIDVGLTAHLYDVWGASNTDLYVAGDGPVALQYDGVAFSDLTPDTIQLDAFGGVWGSEDGARHFLSASQRWEYASGQWDTDVTVTGTVMWSFSNVVFLVNQKSWRGVDREWTQFSHPLGVAPAGIWGVNMQELYAVEPRIGVMRFSGLP